MNPSGKPKDLIHQFDQVPFHQFLGLTLVEWYRDFVRLRLQKTESTPTGVGGAVNGGVIATMVDMAAVTAVFTHLHEDSIPAGTADLQVTYLRPADGDYVDALASVIKRGRQLTAIEVEVRNDQGTLCSKGRVLYALRSGQAG